MHVEYGIEYEISHAHEFLMVASGQQPLSADKLKFDTGKLQ